MGLAQVKPKDYKGIGTVSFYGVVYEGTKIVASDRPFEDFVSLFRSTNDYLAQSKSDLAKAHRANDAAVLEAYGFPKDATEAEIVDRLFKMYQELTSETKS